MANEPIGFDEVLKDPAGAFDAPGEVVGAPGLTQAQKIEILRRWEADARLLMTASEENMAGGEAQQLQEVHDAMRALGVDPHRGD